MKVAILGGGVAGVSSAIALKEKGFDVEIYERNKAETNIGAGIVVWPNAAYVLEKLGVLEQLKSVSGHLSKMKRISRSGEHLGTVNIKSINEIMGYPSLSVLRTDFQNILISKLASLGVSIKYGHEVTRLTVEKKVSQVHFRNGKKIAADIIIGADGRMSSVARKYVLGQNRPVYQGFINWIGVYDSDEAIFQNIEIKDYWGVGERFGIVPVSKHRAYWAGGVASPEIGTKDPEDYRRELKSIFSQWPGVVNRLISETPIDRINKIYVHDQNPIERWHKNNVIVIGDAAHAPLPTSGQGACQALEDAWHLAKCLTKNDNTIDESFSEFTQLRSLKVAGIISTGRELASVLFNTDHDFCKIRDEKSKAMDYSRVAIAMAESWGENVMINT